jgi:hypothetical protein
MITLTLQGMLFNLDLLAILGTGKPKFRGQDSYLSLPSDGTHRHTLITPQKKHFLVGFKHPQDLFK